MSYKVLNKEFETSDEAIDAAKTHIAASSSPKAVSVVDTYSLVTYAMVSRSGVITSDPFDLGLEQ